MADSHFTWIPFYREFAMKLLEYRNNRTKLVTWIYSSLKKDGVSFVSYLTEEDHKSNFTDLDPFSIFAIFNRDRKKEDRIWILEQFKSKLNIEIQSGPRQLTQVVRALILCPHPFRTKD